MSILFSEMKRVFFYFKNFIYILLFIAFFIIMFLEVSKPQFKNLTSTWNIYTKSGSFDSGVKIDNSIDYLRIIGKRGESCTVKNMSVSEIMDLYNCTVCFTEKTDGGISYYCFSKDMKYSKRVKGKEISLQIYSKDDKIVLGTPIIFGGY